jgi:hypothetical protein
MKSLSPFETNGKIHPRGWPQLVNAPAQRNGISLQEDVTAGLRQIVGQPRHLSVVKGIGAADPHYGKIGQRSAAGLSRIAA